MPSADIEKLQRDVREIKTQLAELLADDTQSAIDATNKISEERSNALLQQIFGTPEGDEAPAADNNGESQNGEVE